MSFLNSVLSSIGAIGEGIGQTTATPSTTAKTPPPPTAKNPDSQHSTTVGLQSQAQKRKAADDIDSHMTKVPKKDNPTIARTQPSKLQGMHTISADKSRAALSKDRPRDPTDASVTRTTSVLPKTAIAAAAAPQSPKAPPKKGSYAEILARAQAAQAAQAHVGLIKHKPKEKPPPLSKREREKLAAQAQAEKAKEVNKKGLIAAKGGRDDKLRSHGKEDIKPSLKKKPVEVAYKGTMRAPSHEPPTYKGTMHRESSVKTLQRGSLSNGRSRSRLDTRPAAARYRYASYSDEEEEEEEDQESDASSAMEAAAFEIDEEELTSAQLARKEDEAALREEMELKRQKLEKKKKLTQMAAKRR